MTPIDQVTVTLPIVLGGVLTTVTVTTAVVLWIGARFRDVERALADAVRQVLGELHGVANRVTIVETRLERHAPDAAE